MPRKRQKSKRRKQGLPDGGLFQLSSWGLWYRGCDYGVMTITDCSQDELDEISLYWFANRAKLIFEHREKFPGTMPFGYFIFEKYPIGLKTGSEKYEHQQDLFDEQRQEAEARELQIEFERIEAEEKDEE